MLPFPNFSRSSSIVLSIFSCLSGSLTCSGPFASSPNKDNWTGVSSSAFTSSEPVTERRRTGSFMFQLSRSSCIEMRTRSALSIVGTSRVVWRWMVTKSGLRMPTWTVRHFFPAWRRRPATESQRAEMPAFSSASPTRSCRNVMLLPIDFGSCFSYHECTRLFSRPWMYS